MMPAGQGVMGHGYSIFDTAIGRCGIAWGELGAVDMTGIPGFNRRVYHYARSIPRGETRTYGEVATALRASGAVNSVAQAIAKNPLMIIVPCHRVLEEGHYADR